MGKGYRFPMYFCFSKEAKFVCKLEAPFITLNVQKFEFVSILT